MRSIVQLMLAVLILTAVTSAFVQHNTLSYTEKKEDCQLLFNNKFLDGWPGANHIDFPGNKNEYGFGLEHQKLDDSDDVERRQINANDFYTSETVNELYPPQFAKKTMPLDEWNKSRFFNKKGKVKHWFNSKKILEYDRFSNEFKQKANSKYLELRGTSARKYPCCRTIIKY